MTNPVVKEILDEIDTIQTMIQHLLCLLWLVIEQIADYTGTPGTPE